MATSKLSFLALALIVLTIWATSVSEARINLSKMSMEQRHEQWMATHGRIYKDAAEKAQRFMIFKSNVELIESFNNAGNHKFKLGANKFADLTNEEFRARNGFKSSGTKTITSFRYENYTAAPASMDWRKKGAVTPVKDQGQCGK